MSQQINLYSPLFRKQEKVFSAVAMVQAMALVLLGVGAFYGYVALQSSLLEIQARDTAQRLAGELERLKVTSLRDTPQAKVKTLGEQKKQLEAALAERTRMAQALVGEGVGRHEGYSGLLRALARLSVEGLWLTRVQFAEHEGEVAIAGRAVHQELVAAYLERLRSEEALRGQAFSSLEIRRTVEAERPGVVEFVLTSGVREARK